MTKLGEILARVNSYVVEDGEDKVLSVLRKKIQPVVDELLDRIDDRIKNWGLNDKAAISIEEDHSDGELTLKYMLKLPKGMGVEEARDFAIFLDNNLGEMRKFAQKFRQMPFFNNRWHIDFGIGRISGRGPWEIAIINVREVEKYSPSDAEREQYKDENAFQALQNVIDEIRVHDNGKDLLKSAQIAGRIAPEIVKEAKALLKAMIDFKGKAKAELKQLAAQSDNDYIKRHFSK